MRPSESGRARTFAVAGALVLAVLALGLYYLRGTPRATGGEPDQLCHQNLSFIAQAMTMYATDAGGRLPAANVWHDVLCPSYLEKKPVPCPERPNTDCGYAFNSALANVKLDAVTDPKSTILFFESDGGWDATGGPELLPKQPRHGGGDLYVLLSGDVIWRKRGDTSGLHWQPELKTARG